MRALFGKFPLLFVVALLLSCQSPAFATEPSLYLLRPGERFALPGGPGVADWLHTHCIATDTGTHLCPTTPKQGSDAMPDVTLKGHLCTGHGFWPARPSTEGEPRFTVG